MSELVIIPTYNEIESLPIIMRRLFSALPSTDVLVVDDDSPDGTGAFADALAAEDARVHVLHRAGKLGLGPAYIAGFGWGLENGYDTLIEMDADGSHPPETLPAMLDALNTHTPAGRVGLVIGSRWMLGGRVLDWPKQREILSRGANWYARIMLGIAVKDSTAGFRVFSSPAIDSIDLSRVHSHGYCFQIDMTLRTLDSGYAVHEVPIVFRERELGVSKMSRSIVFEAMAKVTSWGIQRRLAQLRRALPGR